MLSVNLAKPLREKYKIRNIEVRKGDKVKIMRGKDKKKSGKVIEVKTKLLKVYIEGMQKKKTDGSKVNIPFKASNLQIVELNLDDKKRMKKLMNEKGEVKKPVQEENKSDRSKTSISLAKGVKREENKK